MSPRFKTGTHKSQKGYPRVSAGPLRNQYVHRIVAEAMLGRPLKDDEEVHHKDGDKKNFHPSNLMVLGQSDHGWVSAKQAFYMRVKDGKLKAEWDEFMEQKHQEFRGGLDGRTSKANRRHVTSIG